MIAWPPFRMRIFMCSNGVTSGTNWAPTSSKAGRPAGKRSSTTHWMKSSQNTGQASSMPNSSRVIARSRSEVAGAMRSTMPLGKATLSRTQAASFGSCASARPSDGVARDDAVVRDVVAGEHGEGRDAGGAAGAQAGEDQAEHGLGRVGVRGVGGDRRDRRVEGAGGGIDEVAALGDGQRHDAGGGQRQLPEDRGAVHRRQEVGHHPGDMGGRDLGGLLDDGGEPVLALRARRAS